MEPKQNKRTTKSTGSKMITESDSPKGNRKSAKKPPKREKDPEGEDFFPELTQKKVKISVDKPDSNKVKAESPPDINSDNPPDNLHNECIAALEKFKLSVNKNRAVAREKQERQEKPRQIKEEPVLAEKVGKKSTESKSSSKTKRDVSTSPKRKEPQKKGNKRSRTYKKDIFDASNVIVSSQGIKSEQAEEVQKLEDDGVYINIQKDEGDIFDYNDFTDRTPEWALKENCQDAQGRRPDDPEYDPSTLLIPPGALEKLTPLMKQYWQLKSQNFDKIFMFRIGDFYRIFYDDSVICHKELDLNYLGSRMVVGLPEQSFDKYVTELVNRGYRVCTCEQIETTNQKRRNNKEDNSPAKEKIVQRRVAKYLSKGTYINYKAPNQDPKYLLSIRNEGNEVAVSFLEVGYNVITLGYFEDDENFSTFKTLISHIRPDEVIYERSRTDEGLIDILKNSGNKPVFTILTGPRMWNIDPLNEGLTEYYKEESQWPELLQFVQALSAKRKELIMSSFAGMVSYLKKVMIADQIMNTARYELYDPENFHQTRMVLDSQALQHLEILEVEYAEKDRFSGSLLGYIDKTVTRYGKRLMRKWLCAPLMNVKEINERLTAIEDLDSNWEMRERIREELKKLPDFERMCGEIYNLSVKKQENIIYFEDVPVKHMRKFRTLLDNLRKVNDLLLSIPEEAKFTSPLILSLTTLVDHKVVLENKLSNVMPNVASILHDLSNFIVWEGMEKNIPTPKRGMDKDYDTVKDEIDLIGQELTDYLEEIRERFDGEKEIRYVHIKQRYEIEIPVDHVAGSKKPADFEFTSRKKGYDRFVTPKILELVDKLEEAEDRLKNLLQLYICFVFKHFHSYYRVWDRLIAGLAQLDCLCSLSVVSFKSEGIMCRPQLSPMGKEAAFLEAVDLRHPCLAIKDSNFVPNDVFIGDTERNSKRENVILLTGPNMGGKSTILRQVCLAAILAQIGCYVPAASFKMSVVDRIFTRIGASDRLVQGKSTFYIEMEETFNVVKYGTKNSLAIIDELGRGTTTFDGVAIAHAVLLHIIDRLKCMTLFATHYHILADEFRNKEGIGFYHMAYRLDQKRERVIFLYKLTEGECSKSFGLNIAKLVGISREVIEKAKVKAEEFEKSFNLKKAAIQDKVFNNVMGLLEDFDGREQDTLFYLNQMLNPTLL